MPGEGTLVFVLQTLKEELRKDADLRNGMERELAALQKELLVLQGFLEDSTKKMHNKQTFKQFERQIKELVFEVEDTVDICLAKSAAAKVKNFIARSVQKLSTNMAKEVRILREQRVKPVVQGINNEFLKYALSTQEERGESSCQTPIVRIPTQDQSYSQGKIVDFEDEAEVIGYLMESRDRLDVISITGMPGLGKSTLALKIFEHKDVADEFPHRIWIPVSEMSSSKDVFLNILEHFTPKKSKSTQSAADIISAVRHCLVDKKWLLVMDNVSTTEEWENLRQILPMHNSKAKVLLTTSDDAIAVRAKQFTNPHKMKKLGEKGSLELLKLRVFNNNPEDIFPPQLQEIGKTIANKCDGVPLLILVIAGHLKGFFTKTEAPIPIKKEWKNTADIMGDIFMKDQNKLISTVVQISYNSLAHEYSRACFLYMGLFPANQEILASTLTKLWVAEGFVGDHSDVEKVANEVLDDLINKNLVSVAKKNLEQVKTCRVQQLIREFCIAKAMEENFFRVIKESRGALEPPVSEVPNFRRVCLYSNPSRFLSGNPKGTRVRSFLCFLEDSEQGLIPTLPSIQEETATHSLSITIPKAFKLLRVLSCNKSIKFGKFPKDVGNLILLKHITLCIGDHNVLPKGISKLLRLQTLIVDTTSHTINVEANMSEMTQLKCLKTKAAIYLKDENWKGTNSSDNLQTMSRLSPKSCTPALSLRAPNLKTLGIRGEIAQLNFDTFFLDAFRYLEKLKIENDSASENPLTCLPKPICFSPKFVCLTLSKTYLEWDKHMPTLANISTLKFLKLKDNAFTGYSWVTGDCSGFPDLQILIIQNSELTIWNPSDAYFPSLRCLVIKDCRRLSSIPQSLATNLEKLEIESVKQSVADSARKIESNKKRSEQLQKWSTELKNGPFNLIVGPHIFK